MEDPRTAVFRDGDHWVLNGVEDFYTSTQGTRWGTVRSTAVTANRRSGRPGISDSSSEKGPPDLSHEAQNFHKLGMNSSDLPSCTL